MTRKQRFGLWLMLLVIAILVSVSVFKQYEGTTTTLLVIAAFGGIFQIGGSLFLEDK